MTESSDDSRIPPEPGDASAGGKAKLPYHAPRLHVYGDLRALTATVGNMSAISDGGSMAAMSKTN